MLINQIVHQFQSKYLKNKLKREMRGLVCLYIRSFAAQYTPHRFDMNNKPIVHCLKLSFTVNLHHFPYKSEITIYIPMKYLINTYRTSRLTSLSKVPQGSVAIRFSLRILKNGMFRVNTLDFLNSELLK
jgi:hypothetical protein